MGKGNGALSWTYQKWTILKCFLLEEWVVLCVRRFFTVTKACESPTKTNSNGSPQDMDSHCGKLSLSVATALHKPFEQRFGKASFIWGTWSIFLTGGEIWWVTGRAGAVEMWFPFLLTTRKAHFNLITYLSIHSAPVKALNSTWKMKLWCDKRQRDTTCVKCQTHACSPALWICCFSMFLFILLRYMCHRRLSVVTLQHLVLCCTEF